METGLSDVTGSAPPEHLSPPLQALWWLKKEGLKMGPGWKNAHEICQSNEGDKAHDLVHALAHLIEGDKANAAYWYRRCGQQAAETLSDEWNRIALLLSER